MYKQEISRPALIDKKKLTWKKPLEETRVKTGKESYLDTKSNDVKTGALREGIQHQRRCEDRTPNKNVREVQQKTRKLISRSLSASRVL